jgi:hypothetical protein
VSAAAQGSPRAPAGREAPRGPGWAPTAALLLGIALVAGVAAAFNVRVTSFLLDETTIKASAVHYGQGLGYNVLHDAQARSTTRLYSLLISPLFRVLTGDEGVRAARALNGPLFASTAIPAYLLARQALASRWLAVAAGIAAIALPWLALTTAMFTENLAYPVVLWTVLAMAWSFRAPSPRRDLLVVALLGVALVTRTQLIALAGGYAALVVARAWLDRRRGVALGRVARGFPFALAGAAVVVLAALALLAAGRLGADLRSALGLYAQTTTDRSTLPVDAGTGVLVEVLGLALGVGVVPAILAMAWYPRALAGRAGDGGRAVAVAGVCAVVALFAFTMLAQGGFAGAATEERYYFYAAPLLWIGALAALESGLPRPRDLLEAGMALALLALVLAIPVALLRESSFFAPALSTTSYLLAQLSQGLGDLGLSGLSQRDALGLVVALVAVAVAVAWRRGPRRGGAIALAGAGVFQVALTVIAFTAIGGGIPGVPGRTDPPSARALGFIDRATGSAPVTWIDDQPHGADDIAFDNVQRLAMLYNDAIRQRIRVPALGTAADDFPLNRQPMGFGQVGADGTLAIAPPIPVATPFAVETAGSPFLQLEGSTLAASPPQLGLVVKRTAQPLRAAWYATGLGPSAALAPGASARLTAWGDRTATLTLSAASGGAQAAIRLAGSDRTIALGPGRAQKVRLTFCGGATAVMSASGAKVAVTRVDLGPGRCG